MFQIARTMGRLAPVLLLTAWLAISVATANAKVGVQRPLLHIARELETDLEVGGDLIGLPPGSTRFITYRDLLALPQVSYTVTDDHNFRGRTVVSGIPLAQLGTLIGAAPEAKLAIAICYDGYRTNYPTEYIAAHHPLLVLKINGRTGEGWPKSEHNGPLGPYLISHPVFTPAFKVLSHVDQPQVPYGVVRIDFREERVVFGAIAPAGVYDPGSPVISGYRIAQQNCFRCHNSGAEGGQLAGRDWRILAMWAASEPQFFARFIKNPQAIDPKERMPGNPEYDAATIEAVRRYFASFDMLGIPEGRK